MADETSVDYWQARYLAAAHAMQSGVAYTMAADNSETLPKHLRVGVNSAMVDSSALAKLLIEKKVISELEYVRAVAEGMEAERDLYTQRIKDRFGANITLA